MLRGTWPERPLSPEVESESVADMQFETAEYSGGAASCVLCKGAVSGTHWMAGPNTICASCHDQVEATLGRRPGLATLGLGALYGSGAALGGSLVWFAIREATGIEFGILAIGVGYAVSWSILKAGPGGLPQQLIAVACTYLSVVGSYVPTIFRELTADATSSAEYLLAAVVAAGASLAFPILAVTGGDFMWFIIMGIALWSAFSRTGRGHVVWTGPFETRAAPTV